MTTLLLALALSANPFIAQGKDYKDVNLKKLGIPPVEAKKDARTGFVVGGKNATTLIKTLTEINGIPIAKLEAVMRPDKLSYAGFLGKDEKLVAVLAADNKYVVEELGLTHRELARHLHAMGAIADLLRTERKMEGPFEFVYHGRRFKVQRVETKGFLDSPFEDGTKTNSDVVVHNLANDKKIGYSLLVPFMVERYGFYEGQGTRYRVDPRKVVEVFDFLQTKKR